METVERKRQDVVATKLVNTIKHMFYGGTHPDKQQIENIVKAFTATEEYKLSKYAMWNVIAVLDYEFNGV